MSLLRRLIAVALLTSLAFTFSTAAAPNESSERQLLLMEKAEAALETQAFEEALKLFLRASKLGDDKSPEALLGAARAQLELSRFKDARSMALRAAESTESPPVRARASYYIGLSFFYEDLHQDEGKGQGALESAEHAFREALRLSEGSLGVSRYQLAETLARLGREDEALPALREYFELAGSGEEGSHQDALALQCWLDTPAWTTTKLAGFVPARASARKMPVTTQAARKKKIGGTVLLQSVIDEKGELSCTRVIKSLPFGLTQSTIEALNQWQFQPATLHGEVVRARYIHLMNFSLR